MPVSKKRRNNKRKPAPTARKKPALSRSNRTPASDVISPPSKAANTTRLP